MKAEMRFRNYTVRSVSASLFAGLVCLLFLAGCPGTGGSHQGGGQTYTGGTAGSSESPASQAMHSINTGNINKLVKLFTDGIGGTGTASTVPMDFPAEDLWLPEDATIKITMSVNGVTTVYTSTAVNGNFHFDLPAVVSGSTVSVRMDVLEPNGALMFTGRASKTVNGATDTLELTLASTFRITVTPPAGADACVWMIKDPSDPSSWYSIPGDYPDYSFSLEDEGKTAQIGGLAVKNGIIYEIPIQTLTVGDADNVALTMNTAKNFPGCGKLKRTTSGVAGAPYDRILYEITDPSKKPALFDLVDSYTFEVSPYAPPADPTLPTAPTAFQMRALGSTSWANSYRYPDPSDSSNIWKAEMNGAISDTFEMKMHYAIKIDGTVVGEGDVINTPN